MKKSSCRSKIRRWILKSFSRRKSKIVSKEFIQHYLRSNKSGFADSPELKSVLKMLVKSGHLIRIDGNYTLRQYPNPHMEDKPVKRTGKTKSNAKKLPKNVLKSFQKSSKLTLKDFQ
ncbi:hypothetical protein NPIL_204251 [Nephila pilipes]|uniref:Uncharacterized protein n=1 Tax=Nephila pilipes TaxID=299642 RepID=A0A8X6U5J3_NEPPI|nr:hypothetical protein NPIL_204251 [Nephila pilipes]